MRITLAIIGLCSLVLFGTGAATSARADHRLPDEMMSEIMHLSVAAGILSSRSCRDPEYADRASELLSHLLQHLRRSKYFDRPGERMFRREVVIPRIQSQRTLTHSSRDCGSARQVTDRAHEEWRGDGMTAQVSGVFSLGDWGDADSELSRARALHPPATAHGRR